MQQPNFLTPVLAGQPSYSPGGTSTFRLRLVGFARYIVLDFRDRTVLRLGSLYMSFAL